MPRDCSSKKLHIFSKNTHTCAAAYLNFLLRTEVLYPEKQRDKMVSVCDWSTPSVCYAWELTESSTCISFAFLFSLLRCFPRHRPLCRGEPIPGRPDLHKEKRTLPRAPAGFSGSVALPHWMPRSAHLRPSGFGDRNPTPFRQRLSPPPLRTVWPMFNCCPRAKVLKGVTNRKRRLQGLLVDLAPWVSNTRPAIARLHLSLAVGQTLIYNIADTRDHPVREAPLSERLCMRIRSHSQYARGLRLNPRTLCCQSSCCLSPAKLPLSHLPGFVSDFQLSKEFSTRSL